LRVKAVTRAGTGLVFDDEEVMPGVEDLQVQFGIARSAEPSGRAARYVDPGFPELTTAQVVAVRIWLRIRADEAEPLFEDARTYQYAGVVYTPSGAETHFRRVLMTRTVAVRNARVL
jgi:hypothetical protein